MPRGLTAACLALAVAAGCTHEAAREGRIVFQSSRSGDWAIYSVRPDGSDLRRVGYDANEYAATETFWSPSGERLFVSVERDQRGHGLVVDMQTGARTRLGVHALAGADWSPDGERIAVGGERGIVVVDAAGSNRRQLTHHPNDADPAWSPDGERIAFVSGPDLFTVAASGGRVERVLNVSDDDLLGPRWSPDGNWLAVTRFAYDTDRAPLEVARPDGSGRRRLVADADQFAWSPRGLTLVYVRAGDLYRVDVDARNRKRLTFDGPWARWSFDRSPMWSPDGERIAYVRPRLARGIRDPGTPTDVWVMNADGSGKRALTRAFPTGGTNAYPEWLERDPKATPVRPELRVTRLRARHVLRTGQPIGGLAAEGSRAVVVEGLGSQTEFDNPPGPLRVWEPTRGRTRQVPVRGCGTAADPAIAGPRVAFVCDNTVIDLIERDVRISSGRATRTVVRTRATHLVGAPFRSRLVRGVAGSGPLIALGVSDTHIPVVAGWRTKSTRIWRLDGTRLRKVVDFRGVAWVADADKGRIAIVEGKRAVFIVSAAGETVRRFAFGRNQVRDAVLDRGRLVVLLRDRLVVFDVATGRQGASHPLPPHADDPPRLAGVDRDTAVYVTGLAIHVVRLSDRREFVVDTRSAAEPVYADLTEAGLFYSYTDPRGLPAGRAVFVPRVEVERALARAG